MILQIYVNVIPKYINIKGFFLSQENPAKLMLGSHMFPVALRGTPHTEMPIWRFPAVQCSFPEICSAED